MSTKSLLDPGRWAALRTSAEKPLVDMYTDADLDVLARCAVAGVFGRELFTAGGFAEGDGALDALVEAGALARTGSNAPRYRLAGRLGELFWEMWDRDGDPSWLPGFCAVLAAQCQKSGLPMERLRYQLLAEDGAGAAADLLRELFGAADRAFDLPRCHDVLDVLDNPVCFRRLPAVVRDLRDRYSARLRMRSVWADDYRMTEPPQYLERSGLQDRLGSVLDQSPPAAWLLRLQGVGGTGKTTLLRWLSSHHCVGPDPDGPRPTPCVRIDGALCATDRILEMPWLLLVDAAARLRRLLGDDRFDGFLNEFGEYRPLVATMTDPDGTATAPPAPIPSTATVEQRFAEAAAGLGLFILVLDNMDDLYLWGGTDTDRLEDFFRMLDRVHDRTAGLRVIVAGRHDFGELFDPLGSESFPSVPSPNVPVPGFDEDEARRALALRDIDGEMAEAVIERSGGLPIVVSGFARLLRTGGDVPSPADIRSSNVPVLEYLTRRVVAPIANPLVRWILVYACLPEVFSSEFMVQVMLPVLHEHPDGPVREQMDVLENGAPTRRPRSEPWEVPDPADEAAMARLWKSVRTHLKGLAWFTPVQDEPHAFTVQEDLCEELRKQVAGHEAVAAIHRRAEKYFAERSREVPSGPLEAELWPRRSQAAVFHAVHADGVAGLEEWRTALTHARRLGRLDWAESVTRYTAVEFGLVPAVGGAAASEVWRQAPLVDRAADRGGAHGAAVVSEVAYEVCLESARIAAQLAGLLPGAARPSPVHGWPGQCDLWLSRAHAAWSNLAGTTGNRVPRRPYHAILEQLAALGGSSAHGVLRISDLADPASDPEQERDTALVVARIHHAEGDEAAAQEAYLRAFTAARHGPGGASWIAADAVNRLLRSDRLADALVWCQRAEAYGHRYGPDGPALNDLRAVRMRALIQIGRPSEALEAAGNIAENEPLTPACAAAAAKAHLALYRPQAALADLAETVRPASLSPAAAGFGAAGALAEPAGQLLDLELLRADVHRLLLDHDAAMAAFERAEMLADATDTLARARTAAARARWALDALGDLHHAASCLAGDFELLPQGSPEWLDLQLARVELARQSGDPNTAAGQLAVAWAVAERSGARAERVRVQCAALAAGTLLPSARLAEAFSNILAEAEAEFAGQMPRLSLFEPLGACPAPVWGRPGIAFRARVHRLFPPGYAGAAKHLRDQQYTDDPNYTDDAAYRSALIAEFFRVAGDSTGARRHQELAVSELEGPEPFIHWVRLAAVRRVGDQREVLQVDPERFAKAYPNHRELRAAVLSGVVAAYDVDGSSLPGLRMLEQAEEQLRHASPWPNVYRIRLLEQLADRAIRAGRPEAALSYEERAAQDRAALGRPLSEHRAHGPAPDTGGVLLLETPRGVRLTAPPPRPGQPEDVELPMDGAAGLFTDSPQDWSDQMAQYIAASLGARLDEQGTAPAFVGVQCASARFAAQPWELVRLDRNVLGRDERVSDLVRYESVSGIERGRIKLLQRAMTAYFALPEHADAGAPPPVTGAPDGEPGPLFAAAVAQYARERGLAASDDLDPRLGAHGKDAGNAAAGAFGSLVLHDLADFFRERRRRKQRPLHVYLLNATIGGSPNVSARLDRRIEQARRAYRAVADPTLGSPWPQVKVHRRDGIDVFELISGGMLGKRAEHCDIVHVCGVVRAERELPALGTPEGRPPIAAPMLAEVVSRLSGGVPPLLVLDFLAPHTETELRRHLLLRNRFAHQLLALGVVDTVMAVGFEPTGASRQLELLAQELAKSRNAAAACRAIRSYAPPGAPDDEVSQASLPYWATALFSSLPPAAILEPGLIDGGAV